jgi:DNA-binding NtrC family response regulator
MPNKTLLIAPEAVAEPVAEALRRSLDAEVVTAPTRRSGMACLRRREFAIVVLDESLASADPDGAALLYEVAGAAAVLEVNFILSGVERTLRQVRAALARRAHDRQQASADVAAQICGELNGTLTGLLLETELALREAAPAQQHKLQQVFRLAGTLRERLATPNLYIDV